MKKAQTHSPENSSISILLWGKEGVGKTFITSTMPKKILYLTFDPNAMNGLNDRITNKELVSDDVPYIPYNDGDYMEVANAYKQPKNPFGLNEIYNDIKFNTLVIDSLSSFFKLAGQYGVDYASLVEKEKSTVEKPGFAGYGVRSVATKNMIFNVINWCANRKINLIIIAHEGEMIKDSNTGILYRGITLSGDIASDMAKYFDECWYMGVNDVGERNIAVHPSTTMRPLKTRMFDDSVKFVQANNLDLACLLDAWRANGKITNQVLENMKGK